MRKFARQLWTLIASTWQKNLSPAPVMARCVPYGAPRYMMALIVVLAGGLAIFTATPAHAQDLVCGEGTEPVTVGRLADGSAIQMCPTPTPTPPPAVDLNSVAIGTAVRSAPAYDGPGPLWPVVGNVAYNKAYIVSAHAVYGDKVWYAIVLVDGAEGWVPDGTLRGLNTLAIPRIDAPSLPSTRTLTTVSVVAPSITVASVAPTKIGQEGDCEIWRAFEDNRLEVPRGHKAYTGRQWWSAGAHVYGPAIRLCPTDSAAPAARSATPTATTGTASSGTCVESEMPSFDARLREFDGAQIYDGEDLTSGSFQALVFDGQHVDYAGLDDDGAGGTDGELETRIQLFGSHVREYFWRQGAWYRVTACSGTLQDLAIRIGGEKAARNTHLNVTVYGPSGEVLARFPAK